MRPLKSIYPESVRFQLFWHEGRGGLGGFQQATKTIPIVFATHADPVGVGHVTNLARPGGNITGLTVILTDLVAKQLEILKEATRIGVLFNPTAPSHLPAVQG
jgi:putative ABC transport system substrate-binding protein